MNQGTMELDQTDRSLLSTLQRDCRIPLQEVAKKLGVPKSTVHYRIKKLEQEGVIEGYHARVNAAQLGYDYLAEIS